MKPLKHWFVCLDLSKIDDILIAYTKFLTSVIQPETITFLHVMESADPSGEFADFFADSEQKEDVEKLIRKEIYKKAKTHFGDDDIETRVIIMEGNPTKEIISLVHSLSPDLLILGKKTGYIGEGIIARQIVKQVASSLLFVPETSRHMLNAILVPVDFSDQSADAIISAEQLSEKTNGSVIAQHIFKYPSRYFPYMPSDEEQNRIDHYLKDQKNEFIRKHNISDDVKFVFSLNKDGKMADCVYDQVVKEQADLIVTGSKSNKNISGFLRHNFIDKMTYYSFGIPLFIQKNREVHQKFLDKLFGTTSS